MKFIYVMEKRAKKELLRKGFVLLKADERNHIWIFENKYSEEEPCPDLDLKCMYVLSDVLTF